MKVSNYVVTNYKLVTKYSSLLSMSNVSAHSSS